MTVTSETSRNDYIGNASTIIFPYTFKIFSDADLTVILTDTDGVEVTQTLGVDYTVSGALSPSGGNVTMTVAPPGDGIEANSSKLTIRRVLTATQPVDLRSQSKIGAEVLERAHDRAVMLIQQLLDENARSLRLIESEAGSEILTLLPSLADRKGRTLTFDPTTGQPTASSPTSAAVSAAMEPVVASATLALARAQLGVTGAGVSVKDTAFGAAGDGSVDDTAAIQAAITAAGVSGGAVIFPAGTYKVTARLVVGNNVRLVGVGRWLSIIQASADLLNDIIIYAVGRTGIEISDIAVYGNSGNLPLANIQLKTCTKSSVHHCNVRYNSHEGISLNQSTYDCEVYENIIRDSSGSIGWGIGMFWDIQRCKIHHNTILDCGAYGIVIDDGTSGQSDNLPCVENIVSDNIIQTTTTNMWGIAVEGSTDNIIERNIIDIIGGYGIDVSEGNSTVVKQPLRNLIAHNIIRCKTTTVTNGIRLLGGSNNTFLGNKISAGDIGIVVAQPTSGVTMSDNVIADNDITDCAAAGGSNKCSIQVSAAAVSGLLVERNRIPSAGKIGIEIQAGNDITTKWNRIKNTQQQGIVVSGTGMRHIMVLWNEILNAGLAAAGTYAAIIVNAASASITDAVVAWNVIDDNQGTPTTWIGVEITGTGTTFVRGRVFGNKTLNPTIFPTVYLNPDTISGDALPTSFTGGAVAPGFIDDVTMIDITATSNVTIAAASHGRPGNRITFVITQGGAGGYTVTWDASYKLVWSDTGNTVGYKKSVSFIKSADGALIQDGGSGAYL